MIKRTLYFANPCYLKFKNEQLVVHLKEPIKDVVKNIPIEDIGVVLLDDSQITITHNAIRALADNNVAIISCDSQHMPSSLLLPLEGHSLQSRKYKYQIEASEVLKKNLWQQCVIAKIKNQKTVLDEMGLDSKRLKILKNRVQSGDTTNVEGQAAAYYWSKLFYKGFKRDRFGEPPNHLLNYGYAILRSLTARSLVSSGLIPTLGIHHKNQYNAFCLADDIMEPFRPFIDLLVCNMFDENNMESFLSKEEKGRLLSISTVDAYFDKLKRPLMVGMAYTTASLAQCYEGKKRKIIFPRIEK